MAVNIVSVCEFGGFRHICTCWFHKTFHDENTFDEIKTVAQVLGLQIVLSKAIEMNLANHSHLQRTHYKGLIKEVRFY